MSERQRRRREDFVEEEITVLNRDVPVIIGVKGRRVQAVKRMAGLRKLEVHNDTDGARVKLKGTRKEVQEATEIIEDIIEGKLQAIGEVSSTMRIAAESHRTHTRGRRDEWSKSSYSTTKCSWS